MILEEKLTLSVICSGKTTRKNTSRMTLTLLVAANLLIGIIGCDTLTSGWPSEPFTPMAWSMTPKEQRYVFYKDLNKSKRLGRLSKDGILNLLGEPDYVEPNGKYISYTLKYAEKSEYTFNAIYFLEIDFDAKGKATRYFVGSD